MTVQFPFEPTVTFLHVMCRLGTIVPDATDPDAHPDLVSAGGTVTLRADTAGRRVRLPGADGRARMASIPDMVFQIQPPTGELINTSDGSVGAWVLDPSSPGVDPQGFTYTATVTPDKVGTATLEPWTVTFDHTSAAGGVVDLAAAASVAASAGSPALVGRVAALEAGLSGLALDDLADVTTAGATAGQVLGWDGLAWAPVAGGTGGSAVTAGAVVGLESVDGALSVVADGVTVITVSDGTLSGTWVGISSTSSSWRIDDWKVEGLN